MLKKIFIKKRSFDTDIENISLKIKCGGGGGVPTFSQCCEGGIHISPILREGGSAWILIPVC